jgi:hypothetical protein
MNLELSKLYVEKALKISGVLKGIDEKVEYDPLCKYLAYQGPVYLLKGVTDQPGVVKPQERFICIDGICNEAFTLRGEEALYLLARRQAILTKILRKSMGKFKTRG